MSDANKLSSPTDNESAEYLPDQAPEPKRQQPLPMLGRSFAWLGAFLVLFYLAAVLYLLGYGAVLGIEYGANGVSKPPAEELTAALDQHILSPAGIVGIYLMQFIVMMPAILFASHFSRQPWQQTLGLYRFSFETLRFWLMVLIVLWALDYLLNQIVDSQNGMFIDAIAGSKHFFLSLTIVILAPILEESVFRGYLFKAWRNTRLGLSGTLLLTSLLFTSLHIGQYGAPLLLVLFVFSLILGLAREKSGSLWVPIILHSLNNLSAVITIIYLGWV